MIKIENVDVYGWEAAIRGMRNPMNSWEKSESFFFADDGNYYNLVGDLAPYRFDGNPREYIAVNDLDLMMRLRNAGSDHAKYLRMINVTLDITAPLYWWKEFDTYKIGTVANSCSTMHKIHTKEFTLDDFSCEHLDDSIEFQLMMDKKVDLHCATTSLSWLKTLCGILNEYRKKFIETKDKEYWWQMIQLLPTSYNQKRTVQLNYQVLKNIYHARKEHKLDEWRYFCEWIETLPYSELITD